MRSYLPGYDLRVPASLDDALRLLAEPEQRWRPFAGGTDLMVLLEAGRLPHTHYVSLWGLDALRGIAVADGDVIVGALTTYSDVLASDLLSREFPLLGAAARETGGIATQNRGTIGGNIANGSPAADTPPALLVYDAALDLAVERGARRRVPYADVPHRLQDDGSGRRRADRGDQAAAAPALDARELPQGRHAARPGHLQSVLRRRRVAGGRDRRRTCGSRSAASRPPCRRASAAEATVRNRTLDATTIAAARDALAPRRRTDRRYAFVVPLSCDGGWQSPDRIPDRVLTRLRAPAPRWVRGPSAVLVRLHGFARYFPMRAGSSEAATANDGFCAGPDRDRRHNASLDRSYQTRSQRPPRACSP